MPLAPSPTTSVTPAVQVRRYSWHSYAKYVASDKKRKFVGTNKLTDSKSLYFFPQKPLVSRVHLMQVVRKIGQRERSRGKEVTVNQFKKLFANGEKNVTSSSLPDRTAKEGDISYLDTYNSGIGIYRHKYSDVKDKGKSEGLARQEKGKEEKKLFLRASDGKGTIASSINDVTIRGTVWRPDVDEIVAGERLVTREQYSSFAPESFKTAFNTCNRFVNYVLLFLATITNVWKGLTNIVRYGRKCLVGNPGSLAWRESSRDYSCNCFVYILRRIVGYILGYSKKLWLFIILGCKWKENKPFMSKRKEKRKARNMRNFRLVIAVSGLRNLQLGNICETFGILSVNVEKTFLAGKRFRAYLRPLEDLWASCHYYLYIYTITLEFNGKFAKFYEYIYLYIGYSCRLRLSCEWASYPGAFVVKSYTLVYFSSKASLLMIKNHNKYQSINLIGLAHVEKAYSKNRSIIVRIGESCDLW